MPRIKLTERAITKIKAPGPSPVSTAADNKKAVRVQAMLARSLRLTPQSRLDPKTVARRQPEHTGPAPWEH